MSNPDSNSSIAQDRTASLFLSLCPRTAGYFLVEHQEKPWEVKHSHRIAAAERLGAKYKNNSNLVQGWRGSSSNFAGVCVFLKMFISPVWMFLCTIHVSRKRGQRLASAPEQNPGSGRKSVSDVHVPDFTVNPRFVCVCVCVCVCEWYDVPWWLLSHVLM